MNLQMALYSLVAVIVAILVSYLVVGGRGGDMDILLHNIATMQESVDRLHQRVDAFSGKRDVSTSDRLNPELVKQFGDDDKFLEDMVSLKKRKLRAELRRDIAQLENTDSNAFSPTNNVEAALTNAMNYSVFAINYSAGAALLKIQGQVQVVEKGDEFNEYVVDSIETDRVVLRDIDNDSKRVLRLVYNAEVKKVTTGDDSEGSGTAPGS